MFNENRYTSNEVIKNPMRGKKEHMQLAPEYVRRGITPVEVGHMPVVPDYIDGEFVDDSEVYLSSDDENSVDGIPWREYHESIDDEQNHSSFEPTNSFVSDEPDHNFMVGIDEYVFMVGNQAISYGDKDIVSKDISTFLKNNPDKTAEDIILLKRVNVKFGAIFE